MKVEVRPDHGTNVVSAESVIQVEADTIIVIQAEVLIVQQDTGLLLTL